jgi:uncharacterized membrane protein YkoI
MYKWQTAVLALTMMICGAQSISAQSTPLPNAQAANQSNPDLAAPTLPEARVWPAIKCWSDWSEAAVVVRRETLLPVEQVSKLAGAKHPRAEIIKVTLCEDKGRFVYRLLLRERQGQVKSEVLDAR